MSINIFGGKRQVVYAKQNIAISATPMNATNIRVIFEFEPQEGSWRHGRDINSFLDLVLNRGYLVDAIADMDLSDIFFTPPFNSGNAILWETGDPITPE